MGNRKIYKYTHILHARDVQKNMYPHRPATRSVWCCECKYLLANDVTVKLYCLSTDICLQNYVISKVTYYKNGNANYMKLF